MDPLAQALIDRGGYNPVDAANAAKGPRAAELAREFKVGIAGSLSQINKPSINLQDVYDKALISSNVGGYQSEADTFQKQIDQRRKALAETTAAIGDNPYLSEATMTGRIAKLSNKAEADINNYVNQQSIAQGKVSAAKADAQIKLNLAQNQYNIESQDYQNQVNQVNGLLTSGSLNDASESDIAVIAQTIGMSTSMVKSIIGTSKAKNEVKPQLMTVDDGQNQKIVALDSNGKIINTQVIGPSTTKLATGGGGGGGSSSASTKATAAQQKNDQAIQVRFEKAISDGIKQLQSGSQWGEVWNRVKSLFPDAPNDLIDALLGPSWKQPGAYQQYTATKKGY